MLYELIDAGKALRRFFLFELAHKLWMMRVEGCVCYLTEK